MNTSASTAIRLLVVAALTTTVLSPSAVAAGTTSSAATRLGESTQLVMSGEYLVHLGEASAANLLMGSSIEHIGFGIYRLVEKGTDDPVGRAMELSALLGVEVSPNWVSTLFVDNPEPDATDQWSLDNFAQFVGGVADADIDGQEAWDASTGDGVTVAVIDSGADLDHPDLAANLWVNSGEIPGNGIDDDGNGFIDDVNGWDFFGTGFPDYTADADPEDTSGSGHGTAVSGIIAAPINGVGLAGVAPDARIMVIRACGFTECPDSTVIGAIFYAVINGADVINLSLGRLDAGGETAMQIAVQTAVDAGIVVIAAAGNDGTDNDVLPVYPASFDIDGLLSVAMTDHADGLSPASNFGATSVNLGAPGVSVWSLDLDGGYALWSGTSFATPTTAGIAALVAGHRGCYSATQIANATETSGDSVPSLAGVTISGKRANAFGALSVTAKKNNLTIAPAPAAVSFSGGTAGTTWMFGDGSDTTGPKARHVYALGLYAADNGTDTYEIAAGLDFVDTCTNTFLTEIMWLSASGITLGCDLEPNFCPDDTVIRAHMASFLARALDLPPATDDYFTDDEGLSHEENINRLQEAGVTLGCNAEGTLFCPDDEVTRAQMASFLARALGLTPSGTNWFTDDDGLSHEPNINALADAGVTLGCGNDMFCPAAGIERDEMAAFLFRGRTYLP